MSMTLTYCIPTIPDPTAPRHQFAAGGDVAVAVWNALAQLLRCLASFPADAVSVSLLLAFQPSKNAAMAQGRLSLYITASALSEELGRTLRLLLERGPVSRFYELRTVEEPAIPWSGVRSACYIVRREEAVQPLQGQEFHDTIPAAYYDVRSFEPNSQNDYLILDGVLGHLDEPVIIEVSVSPTDISAERIEHARYQNDVKSINRRTYGLGDDETSTGIDFLGTRGRSSHRLEELGPLRRHDPPADDMWRNGQRLHETMYRSHFMFRARVLAQTPAVAHLLAGIVAESAFLEGTYRLLPCSYDPQVHGLTAVSSHASSLSGVPRLAERLAGHPVQEYAGLERLAYVAPAEELTGIFRLPIASHDSPRCIRKDTDPPAQNKHDSLVVGHDEGTAMEGLSGAGIPRGVPVNALARHLFIGGATGSGKTFLIMHMAIWLHAYRAALTESS